MIICAERTAPKLDRYINKCFEHAYRDEKLT